MFLIFQEIRLSRAKLKQLVIFQKGTYKAPKTKKTSAPKKFLVSCDIFVIFTPVKHRKIYCEGKLNINTKNYVNDQRI